MVCGDEPGDSPEKPEGAGESLGAAGGSLGIRSGSRGGGDGNSEARVCGDEPGVRQGVTGESGSGGKRDGEGMLVASEGVALSLLGAAPLCSELVPLGADSLSVRMLGECERGIVLVGLELRGLAEGAGLGSLGLWGCGQCRVRGGDD